MVLEELVVLAPVGAADQGRVVGLDAQPRERLGVELHVPAVAVVARHQVGDHVVAGGGGEVAAGAGVQGAHQGDGGVQGVVVQAQAALEQAAVAAGQGLEELAHQAPRLGQQGGVVGQGAELQQQALAQLPGEDPGGLELLQAQQHLLHLLAAQPAEPLLPQAVADLVEGLGQVAGLVHRIDQALGDLPLPRRQVGHGQLPGQVALQALAGGIALEVRPFSACGGAEVLVGVRPVAVGGELVGDLAGPLRLRRLADRLLAELLLQLQHGVGFQRLLDLLAQVEGGELQQGDGLLQLGRHGQLGADAQLQGGFHGHGDGCPL